MLLEEQSAVSSAEGEPMKRMLSFGKRPTGTGRGEGGEAGVADLVEAEVEDNDLRQGALPSLQVLDLDENRISDTGMTTFADALSKAALDTVGKHALSRTVF